MLNILSDLIIEKPGLVESTPELCAEVKKHNIKEYFIFKKSRNIDSARITHINNHHKFAELGRKFSEQDLEEVINYFFSNIRETSSLLKSSSLILLNLPPKESFTIYSLFFYHNRVRRPDDHHPSCKDPESTRIIYD